jgi:hypothetical protein
MTLPDRPATVACSADVTLAPRAATKASSPGIDHRTVAEGSEGPVQPPWLDTGDCRELGARCPKAELRRFPNNGSADA